VSGYAVETDTVAGPAEALAPPLADDDRLVALEESLASFGDGDLVRYPALGVYAAWIRLLSGPEGAAERLSDRTPSIGGSAAATIAGPWVAGLRACMMRDGVEQALGDADTMLRGFRPPSGWTTVALIVRGTAHALLDEAELATDDLTAAVETGRAVGAAGDVLVAQAQLALLAARQGAWDEARRCAQAAQALADLAHLADFAPSAVGHVATARVAVHEARHADARAALARARRLRPLLDEGLPWLTVQVGLELTRAHLGLGDASAARALLAETDRVLELRPLLGSLVEDARELRGNVTATSGSNGAWAMSLTGAELRLLPYLATHLTFPEIAGRLFISRNTVKTEAGAIYRKLSASSRSEAIERAVEVGLLESSIYPPPPTLQAVVNVGPAVGRHAAQRRRDARRRAAAASPTLVPHSA
jgi:LuxR family transcriptional regulator, maltose regulon positive regulatory protein